MKNDDRIEMMPNQSRNKSQNGKNVTFFHHDFVNFMTDLKRTMDGDCDYDFVLLERYTFF